MQMETALVPVQRGGLCHCRLCQMRNKAMGDARSPTMLEGMASSHMSAFCKQHAPKCRQPTELWHNSTIEKRHSAWGGWRADCRITANCRRWSHQTASCVRCKRARPLAPGRPKMGRAACLSRRCHAPRTALRASQRKAGTYKARKGLQHTENSGHKGVPWCSMGPDQGMTHCAQVPGSHGRRSGGCGTWIPPAP
jgi:hypothetical protein